MKKILTLLLFFLLIITLVACTNDNQPPVSSSSTETIQPATTEPSDPVVPDDPDFVYEIIDGTAIITGYTGKGGDITIPTKLGGCRISEIVDFTFAQNKTITSVTYPGDVESIGDFAFYGCSNLKTVVLQEGVKTVSRGAFSNCTALTSVTLPSSVTVLEDVAFQGDKALESITLHEGITAIGERAFANSGLKSVVVPSTALNLGSSLFEYSKLEKAEIKCAVEELPRCMFHSCFDLKEVSIAEGPTEILYECFFRCFSIETLTLPSTVERLRDRCLYGMTSLKTLNIKNPEFYKSYSYVFHWMPAIETINFAGTPERWETVKEKTSSSYNEDFHDPKFVVNFNVSFD